MKTNNKFNQLAQLSSGIRKLTLKRLEEVPAEFINWRLNNTAMSFAHLAKHIIDVDEIFFSLSTTNKRTIIWVIGSQEPHFEGDVPMYSSMLNTLKTHSE